MEIKKSCVQCGDHAMPHWQQWIDAFIREVFLQYTGTLLPHRLFLRCERLLEWCCLRLHIFRAVPITAPEAIPLRSQLFIRAAEQRGIPIHMLVSPFGKTNYFTMHVRGKTHSFEGLPRGEAYGAPPYRSMDHKGRVKRMLARHGFPIATGRAFWSFEKGKALRWTTSYCGFPCVVKPATGSFARHVWTRIDTPEHMRRAMRDVCRTTPRFMVEQYVAQTHLFRFTVVNAESVACIREDAASVIGDGAQTLRALIEKKQNAFNERAKEYRTLFHSIIINDDTKALLKEQRITMESVIPKERRVILQYDPFLALGAELVDVTDAMHDENKKLVQNIARLFHTRLVGIDIMMEDVARPWRAQRAAILELNSLPSIEMHAFPSKGKPRDIAGALVSMVQTLYT